MRFLGFEITRKRAPPATAVAVDRSSAWYPIIREPFTGAWQRNISIETPTVLSDPTTFRCIALISSDIAKLRIKLVKEVRAGIWDEVENPAYTPVLRKPNRYQTRIQFLESWLISKLTAGNTFVLKERDERNVVIRLYILDPRRVKVLVAGDGSIYYACQADNMSGGELMADVVVPQSEIIHDRWNCLHHPMFGISPLYAAGLPATLAHTVRTNSTIFFGNASTPSGVLTTDGAISDETAARLKTDWETRFGGDNRGKVAILGDNLKYESISLTAEASQLSEQLKLTREDICAAFGVPQWKVSGTMPLAANAEISERSYYSQTLQVLIEAIELCLDEGLGLSKPWGTELDVDNLLRLDTKAMVESLRDAVGAGVMSPNEARAKLNLPPVAGGSSPYLQQQNFSLEALAKRDAKGDPFTTTGSSSGGGADTSGLEKRLTALEAARRFEDKGVWQSGEAYEAGDGVTFSGGYWLCQHATTLPPGGNTGWRLAVRSGRDAKEPRP